MRPMRLSFSALSVLILGTAGQVSAQTPNIRVAGRVQTHYSTVSGDSSSAFNPNAQVTSLFEVRRLRIQADVRIGENVNMVIQPSFEMGSLRMRDAFLRVGLIRQPDFTLGLTMGQEKKPFNRYELTSSNNLLSIERGARLRGVSAVAQNNLLEANGYIAHDLGASLDASLRGGRLQFKAGMYNGSGESAADVNNAKTFGLRATATVMQSGDGAPQLRVGAAYMSRDRAVCTTATATCAAYAPDSSYRSSAINLEAEWGDFRPGLHLIADFATGDNLPGGLASGNGRNSGNLRAGLTDTAFVTFRSLQVIAGWRWQPEGSGSRLVTVIEPALRVDVTDPNTSVDSDGGMLITPVINLYFTRSTVLRAGLDFYRYTDATGTSRSARAVRVAWQSSF